MFRNKSRRLPAGDRSWTSSPRKKLSSHSAFKSWTSRNAPAKAKPPPVRSWQSNGVTRVCLICLQHFNESWISPETSSDEEEQDEETCVTVEDPLSGEAVAINSSNLSDTVKIPKRKRTNLYVRFLTILSRHLRVKTKRFRNSASKNELKVPFCVSCTRVVKNLCKVYEEFHNAKLGVQWRLRQISDSIKCSKVSVSGKLQCTLLKALSTQLKVVSSRAVDVFRKQVSVRCSAKLAGEAPRVSMSRNSIIDAVKANWKCKFPFDQMKHYLQSLIVVFALAVQPKEKPPEKKPIIGPKSKTRKVRFEDRSAVKREVAIEDKKENVPPKEIRVKREPGQGGDDHGGGDDDDHFGGGDYSPPGSGPVSPAGGGDDDGDEREVEGGDKNPEDSDWSGGAASANDSAGSDVEFSVNTNTVRRWNLRGRKTRSKSSAPDGGEDASDEEYTPGTLPPLRARRKILESDLKFSCNLCSQKFTQERYLKRHLGLSHSFLMVYNCPKCTLRFKTSKELQAHRKREHPKRLGENLPYMGVPTACTFCDKMFPSKIKMLIHRKTTHKNMTTTLLKCDICGKEVRGQMRMDFHVKTHNRPDKPHRCDKCPRAFATADGLRAHTKLHDANPNWVPWNRYKVRKGPVTPREGVFPCDIPGCNKTFYKLTNLTLHKSLHENEYRCEFCEFRCNLPRDFRKHLMSKHETEEKKFFCLHCDKSYTLEQTYVLHRKMIHPSKAKIPCDDDVCQELFENTEQLRQHLKTMHLPPDVEETKENVKFSDVYSKDESVKKDVGEEPTSFADVASKLLKPESQEPPNQFEDLLKIDDKPKNPEDKEPRKLYTCPRCDWSFSKKLLYSLHLIIHTPRDERRLYQCELCDKSFGVVDSLQTHYNRIHGPKIKPYLCLICGVRFHRKESFIPHMRIHNDKGSNATFECDIDNCGKKFFDSVNLQKHRRIVHFKNKDGSYSRECDVEDCKETFPSKLLLQMHKVEKHGMEKPYVCHVEECGKGFFNATSLKDHMICHGEATFQCKLCPKKFKRRHNLADHYLVHKQEPNFFCEFCGKGFVKKSSLNLHLDIHRGIKKYKCDHCGKDFCRKFARDCHLRTHTGERPFICTICGRNFAQYSALKTHVRNHEKYNNDKVVRVPFRKSLAVGKPLRQRKKKTDDGDEKRETEVEKSEETPEQVVESKEEQGTLYSGILHEAMKATFDDINLELEIGVVKEDQGSAGVSGAIIDEGSAAVAVGAVEQQAQEDNEEEKVQAPGRKKRGRRPKVFKKEYSCGFCGKVFNRHDFFKKHVDKHMEEVESSPVPSGGDASIQSQHSLIDDHNSLQEVLQGEPEQPQPSLRRNSITQPIMNSPVNVPQQHYASPPPPPQAPPPQAPPQQTQEQPRRRGRPPKQNTTPGSRLARIVEDVLETAINRPVTTRHQQAQYHQVIPSPQHNITHSPSPHQIPHSGSERSTPTGSPAPNQHYQHQPVTTTSSLPFQSSAATILSPFLFTNPYLIPRMPDQQQQGSQQDPMFGNFQNRQQPGFSQHLSQASVNYPQQQFHQPPIHTPSPQGSARTMPQDLSKSNYSMFYNNNQR